MSQSVNSVEELLSSSSSWECSAWNQTLMLGTACLNDPIRRWSSCFLLHKFSLNAQYECFGSLNTDSKLWFMCWTVMTLWFRCFHDFCTDDPWIWTYWWPSDLSVFIYIFYSSGNPPPHVTWFKDGQEVTESEDFHLLKKDSCCTLLIQEVFSQDTGTYSCLEPVWREPDPDRPSSL